MVFSTKPFERSYFEEANQQHQHQLTFLEARLNEHTAVMAEQCEAVCVFVNDQVDRPVLEKLARGATRLLALRCAGFNQVDVAAAHELGMTIARVPAYSPDAVAEHTVGLMLTLNRKIHRAYTRVREGDFSLNGLVGFDMRGKTIGIVGAGKIGAALTRVLSGFECRLLGYDLYPNEECRRRGLRYVSFEELLEESHIVTLHCPLTKETHHIINQDSIPRMKRGAMLINTSRGALIDTPAVIRGLKSKHIGSLGLDVYEEEGDLFFKDLSEKIIEDDVFARLLTFPNVVITAHQAFLTREALTSIAAITLANISDYKKGDVPEVNLVTPSMIVA